MNRYLEINTCVNLFFLLWIIAASFINIQGVDGIMCVQCSTLVESSEKPCKSGDIAATNCSNDNDTACIKYKSTHNGIDFIIRGCDNKRVSEVCENRMIEGEVVPTCYYRCFSDGCNDAKPLFHTPIMSLAFILMFSYLISETAIK